MDLPVAVTIVRGGLPHLCYLIFSMPRPSEQPHNMLSCQAVIRASKASQGVSPPPPLPRPGDQNKP